MYDNTIGDEDEIDLYELYQTVKKRKFVIFITIVLFLIAASLYIFTARPVYNATVGLSIGKELVKTNNGTFETKYFDNVNKVKQYIDIKYDTSGKYRKKSVTSYIDKVTVGKKVPDILTIVAVGPNNKAAVKTVLKPVGELFAKEENIIKAILQAKTNKIENIQKVINYDISVSLPQLMKNRNLFAAEAKKTDKLITFINTKRIPLITSNIDKIEKEIADKELSINNLQLYSIKMPKKSPELETITIPIKISNLKSDITMLKAQMSNLKSELNTLMHNTVPYLESKRASLYIKTFEQEAAIKKLKSVTIPQLKTDIKQVQAHMKAPYLIKPHIIGKIYTHDKPIKPKKNLILIVALVTGLIFGIFIAFFMEFIGKHREIEVDK